MVSTRPPASKSSSPFNIPLVTVPKGAVTIGIIVTFMFQSLLLLLLLNQFESFSHQRKLMVLHWSLSDSKSAQVSRTLLSNLADLHHSVV